MGELPTPKDKALSLSILKTGLENLPVPYNLLRRVSVFVNTNDRGFGRVLTDVHEDDVQSNRLRVAVIVGNGGVQSVIDRLPADVAIMLNHNRYDLEWAEYTVQAQQAADTRGQYLQTVYSYDNPLYPELERISPETPSRLLHEEIRCLGDLHFLRSEEAFQHSREALTKKEILPAWIELLDNKQLAAFARLLRNANAEITFANFTNVWDFLGNEAEKVFTKRVAKLPFREDALIVHSRPAEGILLTQPIRRGLEEFIEAYRK